jgi:hypothetical protein
MNNNLSIWVKGVRKRTESLVTIVDVQPEKRTQALQIRNVYHATAAA